MSNRETIAVIKDSLFELVMCGMEMRMAIGTLRFRDGFDKEDIKQALSEMVNSAREEDESDRIL